MLAKFKEEREKRKTAPPASGSAQGSAPPPGGAPPRGSERDYRSSRDDFRGDKGYERHGSSRYE
jgi:hypothetical protein